MADELTECERIVYAALCEAADLDLVCPTNLDLEMLTGLSSSSMGPKIISRLEAKGLIVVIRFQRFRQVLICATGKWTRRSPSQHGENMHIPRGARSASYCTDRKPYKRGLA